MPDHNKQYLPRHALQQLLDILQQRGYRCIGPQLKDGAIAFDVLEHAAQLPSGMRDRQEAGSYRLEQVNDQRMFAWVNGPQALKPLLFAPREPLWRARRTDQGFEVESIVPDEQPLAVIGVRACDLAALHIQDRHFISGQHADAHYAARREFLFLVAVNCIRSAPTCFCVSTGDGPRATSGYDIALTELDDGFVAEAGSDPGARVLAEMNLAQADQAQINAAEAGVAEAAAAQSRKLPGRNLRQKLFSNLLHERWDDVAKRCLSCGNCTLVCPTCFCHAEAEAPALDGASSTHWRQWDSCFSEGHAYIHGMQLRPEIKHRYRQWLTHKLGSWHDQFGRSGCVGCGRCISWCPVGIDITEEAAAICGEAHVGAA